LKYIHVWLLLVEGEVEACEAQHTLALPGDLLVHLLELGAELVTDRQLLACRERREREGNGRGEGRRSIYAGVDDEVSRK
jgi:hypothetical protein